MTNFIIHKKYNIPIVIRIIPPAIVDIFPTRFLILLPRSNPKKVKRKLVMENVRADSI